MKNTTLMLHWWWGDSEGNWFPWLKKEIEFKMDEVFIPNLPSTQNPVIEQQLEYIDIYNSDFSEWGYIIGHSLWCQLALKFIEENSISNSKIILVWPSYPKLWDDLVEVLWDHYSILEKYYNTTIDLEKISHLNNEYVVFLSDNDKYINLEKAKKYYSNLSNVKFVEFSWKWHFNEWSWIVELEEILEYLK